MGSLFKKKSREPVGVPPQIFQQLCQEGERADRILGQGQAEEAQALLGNVFKRMLEAGVADEFILAKLCLSSMQASIVRNEIPLAFAIWTGKLPGPPGRFYAMGIQAIETGVLDVRDTLIYQTTSTFLHACNTDYGTPQKLDSVLS